jgi:hypothetical protein
VNQPFAGRAPEQSHEDCRGRYARHRRPAERCGRHRAECQHVLRPDPACHHTPRRQRRCRQQCSEVVPSGGPGSPAVADEYVLLCAEAVADRHGHPTVGMERHVSVVGNGPGRNGLRRDAPLPKHLHPAANQWPIPTVPHVADDNADNGKQQQDADRATDQPQLRTVVRQHNRWHPRHRPILQLATPHINGSTARRLASSRSSSEPISYTVPSASLMRNRPSPRKRMSSRSCTRKSAGPRSVCTDHC